MKKRTLKLVAAGAVLVAMLLAGIEGYKHHMCQILVVAHEGMIFIEPTDIHVVGEVKIWTVEKIQVEHNHLYKPFDFHL
jgi:hypothetical protein